MSKPPGNEYENFWVEKDFGGWLKGRRQKKGLSLDHVALQIEVPVFRLKDLERGVGVRELSDLEIDGLAQAYGLDPRAIKKRARASD